MPHRLLKPILLFLASLTVISGAAISPALSESYEQVIGGMLLSGIGSGFLFPNTGLWIAAVAPARLRGRLMGGLTTSYFLGQFSTPFLLQPFTSEGSLDTAFGLAAIFMGGLALVFGLGHWYVKRLK